MQTNTVHFITEMKLRELRLQRAIFRDSYRQIRQEVEAAPDSLAHMERLYAGLQKLQFAGQKLHPEVVNLEIVLSELEAGTLSAAVLKLWQTRLETELAAGELRSEFVYLFGALLEEWARTGTQNQSLQQEAIEEGKKIQEQALAPIQPTNHRAFFDAILEKIPHDLSKIRDQMQKWIAKMESMPVFLGNLLTEIQQNIYHSGTLRQEAKRFNDQPDLMKELTDALNIFLPERFHWDWAPEGHTVRTLWTRNKWRMYLDLDLPTVCLLEILGFQWADIWQKFLGSGNNVQVHQARIEKLMDLHAPEVIMTNERRMLDNAQSRKSVFNSDPKGIWDDELTNLTADQVNHHDSVQSNRAKERSGLKGFHVGPGYDDDYGSWTSIVKLLHAEVQLLRSAFPDRPLYVLKIDLEDFYPSIPHEVLLTLLEKLGISEKDRGFFARFLTVPIQTQAGNPPERILRGVPMNFALSGALAELLMRFLDLHLENSARARIIRLVDDICILAGSESEALKAWAAVEEFTSACGLRINTAKSGAVCMGGILPPGLPTKLPRLAMLQLNELGQWTVHQETFESHLKQARERVESSQSVFAKVQQYNANVRFLLNALAVTIDLGPSHRRSINKAIQWFHRSFFATGTGIVAGLSRQIVDEFEAEIPDVPEAWIYWPLTAGGLGLQNPLVTAGQYAESVHKREPVLPPSTREANWDIEENEWSKFYKWLLEDLEEAEPQTTPVMKTLVDDFIKRGQTISAGKQTGLSAYWRWILYTYGPQILEKFATFRFLITELVPMQLISSQRLQSSSLDGSSGSAGED